MELSLPTEATRNTKRIPSDRQVVTQIKPTSGASIWFRTGAAVRKVTDAGQGGRAIRSTGNIQTAKAFFLPKLHRIAEFLLSQGVTIACNLLFGLLCVRLLPVGEYAKFVVVFAIQGSLMVLLDVGISGAFVPLIGDRIEDRQLIADYLASLRQIAHWLYAIAAPLTVVAFPLLVRNRHWNWQTVAAMIAIVLVSAWFARVGASYGSVLIVRRDRYRWYRTQIISGFGALALLGVFVGLHRFGAFTAILIGVAKIIAVAIFYYSRAHQLLGVEGQAFKREAHRHHPTYSAGLPQCRLLRVGGPDLGFPNYDFWPNCGGSIRRGT